MSSNNDIHIGTKRHLTISTSENLVVESEKTYLGDPNKKTMDNMILGSKVQEAFTAVIDMVKGLQIFTQAGNQSPLPPSIAEKESQIKNLIDSMVSTKHFIEEN